MPKIEELEEKVSKFEDKIQLGNLLNEKRFADLELKIGELNEKLKDLTTDLPKLKERASEIENLLDVVNLGLVDYKDNFEKIDSRVSEFVKIPETLESVRANLENKMRELNESVINLAANVEVLKNLKEDIIKNVEETISSKFKTIEEGVEHNKVEIEHVKRDLDGFSVALRSFERTIELTNLDEIIRRFDSLDRKMVNNETELDKLRRLAPDISMTTVDVEILKKKLKEMGSTIMDVLNKMNEFEINTYKKIAMFDDLIKKAESVDKVYSELSEKVSILNTVNEEINKLKSGMEELRMMKSSSDEMITEIKNKIGVMENEKFSSLMGVNEEINKLKMGIEELKTMKTSSDGIISDLKNEVITETRGQLPREYEMRISKLEDQISSVSSVDFDNKLSTFRERVEDIEKTIMNINRSLSSYSRMNVEPRTLKVEGTKEIPKNIIDEINSLKDIISRLSSDNNDLKKIIRDLRIHQMETITTDIFVGVTARISTIEKKLSEIEEEISKIRNQ